MSHCSGLLFCWEFLVPHAQYFLYSIFIVPAAQRLMVFIDRPRGTKIVCLGPCLTNGVKFSYFTTPIATTPTLPSYKNLTAVQL